MKEPREFQIWSYEHDAWWAPDSCGYVTERGLAGLYTESEAADICLRANRYLPKGTLHEVMVHRDSVFATQPTRTGAR